MTGAVTRSRRAAPHHVDQAIRLFAAFRLVLAVEIFPLAALLLLVLLASLILAPLLLLTGAEALILLLFLLALAAGG